MRHLTIAVLALGLLGAPASPPGSSPGQEVTISGELVGWVCFNRDGASGRGPDHAECAKSCAERGQPVALVTEEGDLYLLSGALTNHNNAALVPHMGHQV
jgi:hypothetical protein